MDKPLHSLLRRQLKHHVGDLAFVGPEWRAFIEAVDAAYRQSDQDRLMIERSLDLSSEELMTSNSRMQDVLQELQAAQQALEARQAAKMEAIGRLAGGVAHEFNNLLTVMVARAEHLYEQAPVSSCSVAAREILDAAESAAVLIRQLLALGRQQVLQPQHVDVNGLLQSLRGLLTPLLGERIDVAIECRPDTGWVSVDVGQLQQVVFDLVTFARESLAGHGRIVISTGRVTEQTLADGTAGSADHAEIVVADNGPGIPAEDLARVFEPFYTSTGQPVAGGLGLSTAYGVVLQSGGRLDVSSVVGEGTRFRILLPSVAPPVLAAAPTVADMAPAGPARTTTILVVEDQEAVRRLLAERLAMAGYRVLDAVDGVAALAVADTEPVIDLLLTDVVMPNMNGRALAERLRQLRPGLPVVFMTGHSNDPEFERAVQEGREVLLRTPLRSERMLAVVRDRLAEAH
ncbi:MAG: response regulator [Acidobacteria bacterium]|nr:response regulator [Acidobacteriota bacterium]